MTTTQPTLTMEAAGGLSAGIIGTVIGFPFDTIKTRMQTRTDGRQGILATGRQIARQEGFVALYRGVAPPLISLTILNTLNFTSYAYWRKIVHGQPGWDVRNGVAGAMFGPPAAIISTVENLVKTQMQVDNVTRKQFTGSWHCLQTLVREHGLSVIYTGHLINTSRELAFLSSYFFTYEGFRHEFHKIVQSNPVFEPVFVPFAGGLAGAVSWAFSFPLDCIRAGVQSSDPARPRSSSQVFRSLMETKGIRGLYSGMGASVARAFVVSGTRFSAYEATKWFLSDR